MLFNNLRAMLLCLLSSVLCLPSCGGGGENGDQNEGEAEGEGEGDDPCPPEEGCSTDIVCTDISNCPSTKEEPCRTYRCDTPSATCRWNLFDRDGDGFAAHGCGGRDCNDASGAVYPGAPEYCNGQDENCDDNADEGLVDVPCGLDEGVCTPGVWTCTNGRWSECVGKTAPTGEICDGLDNDCNGEPDDGLAESCGSSVGQCWPGKRECRNGEWSECEGSWGPMPEECDDVDSDCDGVSDNWDPDIPCCYCIFDKGKGFLKCNPYACERCEEFCA